MMRWDTEMSWLLQLASQLAYSTWWNSRPMRDFVSIKILKFLRNITRGCPLTSTHTCTHYTHIHIHTTATTATMTNDHDHHHQYTHRYTYKEWLQCFFLNNGGYCNKMPMPFIKKRKPVEIRGSEKLKVIQHYNDLRLNFCLDMKYIEYGMTVSNAQIRTWIEFRDKNEIDKNSISLGLGQ